MSILIEDKELYGENAQEWLRRWDAGNVVWTIEMGGLGPGYEQCIAILTAEILRIYLNKQYDFKKAEKDDLEIARIREERDKLLFEIPEVARLGVTGAEHGAACCIAGHLYRRGPIAVMNDPEVKDRHIQISKNFP